MQIGATPAPSFEDPLALWQACHGRVRHFCALTQRLVGAIQTQGIDADVRSAAEAILRYFEVAAPLHHQDEEEDLFPLLRAKGDAALIQQLKDIENEHALLHRKWSVIRGLLQKIAAGETAPLTLSLVSDFAEAYIRHADSEETQLLPSLRVLLSTEELSLIADHMVGRRRT